MSTPHSQSSASSSSSRASSPTPHLPPSPASERSLSPSPVHPAARPFFGTPPLESHPYTPHSVGIGILSPQPILGPLAPLTRASISPLQARSSPSHQRSNPFDSPAARHTSPSHSPADRATDPLEDVLASSSIPRPVSPGPSTGATGLRIAIPPPNPSSSTSIPSPPLLSSPTADQIPSAHPGAFDIDALPPMAAGASIDPEVSLPSTEFNLGFTEFDADGLSALEKIYLFSRSTAGFHRVFIVHALPRYLGSDGADAQSSSREESEHISPLDAVMYVLPLLNGLAMDDDEAVKEALAAELVPIIWWFITHCKLVEEDQAPLHTPDASFGPFESYTENVPTSQATDVMLQDSTILKPTAISVQAFTPILGTLLLSQNGLVGGPARYAVVELLRRIRCADEDAAVTASAGHPEHASHASSPPRSDKPDDIPDVGLLGRDERRLFEREIVHQVVIGMGRLDMSDDSSAVYSQDDDDTYREGGISPGTATAVPTPMAGTQTAQDSYFPALVSASTQSAVSQPSDVDRTPSLAVSPPNVLSPSYALTASPPAFESQTTTPESFSPPASGSSSSIHSTPSLSSSSSSESYLPSDILDTATPPILLEPALPSLIENKMDVDMPARIELASEWAPASPPQVHVLSPTISPVTQEVEPMVEDSEVPPDWQPIPESSESALDEGDEDNGSLSEEAAMGRLSSMSLMAAVTASVLSTACPTSPPSLISHETDLERYDTAGSIRDETREAFVAEVERVGRDPVYWVRREATFAVGALAKVVPDEVVITSLLPLFESLRQDGTWHVRHSVLFALPAILARLPQMQRRALALDVMLPLARDEPPTVRSAVLEMLGEVIYTFADDPTGPPRELLDLFIGTRDPNVAPLGDTRPPPTSRHSAGAESRSESESGWSDYSYSETGPSGDADIYEDPARSLVCAFNIPAVALTLGRVRWTELRALYAALAQDSAFKVRRTLAASLGVLAEIVGPAQAREDLLDVWRASVHAEEGEVRLKAIECTAVFAVALDEARRGDVVRALVEQFQAKQLNGWREREEVAKILGAFVEMSGVEEPVLRQLLIMALEDHVSAVREAAISAVPAFVKAWKSRPDLIAAFSGDLRSLAGSDSFRKRTTYVACKQALVQSAGPAEAEVVLADPFFWDAISALVHDPIVDVRIRVARLLGLISDMYGAVDDSTMTKTVAHAQRLAQDRSREVQAFASSVLRRSARREAAAPVEPAKSATLFSRPPPPTPR